VTVSIDLSGRAAIVTGGASGIGQETVYQLARAGARVCVADVQRSGAEAVAAEARKIGADSFAAAVDIRDCLAAESAVLSTVDRFGSVDILVNSAAAWTVKPFEELSSDDYYHDIGISLIGTMIMSRAAYDVMRDQHSGAVVNLISDSGRVGERCLVAYGAAKAGVVGFTKGFALEAARHGIRVNAVSPGTTKTPGAMPVIDHWGGGERIVKSYPLRRLGNPIDQANAILFLCSDMSDWITGQVLSVNGGFTMVD
jgi:NAD(P)-dependent dehydrogenase (short-subunit alcohol dehydrogenase family)